MEQEKQLTSLPENAYRELKPGEEYVPMMPADAKPKEVNSMPAFILSIESFT